MRITWRSKCLESTPSKEKKHKRYNSRAHFKQSFYQRAHVFQIQMNTYLTCAHVQRADFNRNNEHINEVRLLVERFPKLVRRHADECTFL